jgi:mRNA interferase RelE/StbE
VNVRFKKIFLKDLNKIPEGIRTQIHQLIFVEIPETKKFIDLKNIRKIKGYNTYFQFKVGNYRIGFEFEKNLIVFFRVLHRKDIYKYFPL